MIRRPPRSTQSRSSAASDVYKRQALKTVGRHWSLPFFILRYIVKEKLVSLNVNTFCRSLLCRLVTMLMNPVKTFPLESMLSKHFQASCSILSSRHFSAKLHNISVLLLSSSSLDASIQLHPRNTSNAPPTCSILRHIFTASRATSQGEGGRGMKGGRQELGWLNLT